MDAMNLLQWKIENDIANAEENKKLEHRKKDLYVIDYVVPAFIASPADKYMKRKGPFHKDIEKLSRDMDKIILEQGRCVNEKLDPMINDGIIGCLYWNKSYRLLNCIVEQIVQSVNTHLYGQRYELFYKLSIMGRERPVNNVFKVLSDEYWDPDPFINRLVKPEIKRYENLEDLCPNDYKSIAKLVKKLKLIATMEYKGTKRSDWKWMK